MYYKCKNVFIHFNHSDHRRKQMRKIVTNKELNNAEADIYILSKDRTFQKKLKVWEEAHKVKKDYLSMLKGLILPFTRFIKSGVSMNKNHRDKLIREHGITVATFDNQNNQKVATQCFNVWHENNNEFNAVSFAGVKEHERIISNHLREMPNRKLEIGIAPQDEVDIC